MSIVAASRYSDPKLQWFPKLRFGMFVHFGIYAPLRRGECQPSCFRREFPIHGDVCRHGYRSWSGSQWPGYQAVSRAVEIGTPTIRGNNR